MPQNPKSLKNLRPTRKGDPDFQQRIDKMQNGLKKYQEAQRLKRQTDAQIKQGLEGVFQKLSLEDLSAAIEAGEINPDTINIALTAARTIEDIEKIPLLKRTKDLNDIWKFCMTQLKSVTGQEAAKKVEQNVDMRDNTNMTKEELHKKAAEYKQKYGHAPDVGEEIDGPKVKH